LRGDLQDNELHAEALALLRVHPAMAAARERTNAVALEAQALLEPLAGGRGAGAVAGDSVAALSALVVSVVDRVG